MGNLLGGTPPVLSWSAPPKVLLTGMFSSGKTTLIHRLGKEPSITIPTIGMVVEKSLMQGVEVVSWDVGGRCNIRPLYRHYYPDMRGIIYVVDSSSRDEIVWSKEELSRLLAEELLLGLPLLIVANKMDVPTALTLEDVAEGLDLSIIISKSSPRKYQVIGCSTNGLDGIKGGLSWLRAQIRSASYSSPNTLKKETSVFTKYDSDNDNMTEIVGDSSSALDENDTTAEHLESNHPPLDTESLDDEISGRNTILTTS